MFRKKNKVDVTKSVSSVGEKNPYLESKHEWNNNTYAMVSSKNGWQLIAIGSVLISLASVGGILYIGNQSKFIPFVVQTDKLGKTLAIDPANKAYPEDVRIIKAMIASFINDSRMVTPDVVVQRKAVFNVYSMLNAGDPSIVMMGEYMNPSSGETPFARAAKKTVSVEIESILPQSKDSWQVDWIEIERERDGAEIRRFRMRAVLNIYSIPSDSATTEEQIRKNPLGIFVRDFSWTKQQF